MLRSLSDATKAVLVTVGLVRQYTSDYACADYIESLIRDKEWRAILNSSNDPRVVDINLRQAGPDDAVLGYQFKLRWKNLLERNCPLVLFFPNHPNVDLQILHTAKASSLADLDKDINQRLADSTIQLDHHDDGRRRNVGHLLLAIASGQYMYRVWGIDKNHNLYLYWLSHLNKYNVMGHSMPPRLNIPTLAEFDGHGNMINIVPLEFEARKDHDARVLEPLNLSAHERSYIMVKRGGETLFNLERDTRQELHRTIVTTGDSNATNDVLSMSVTHAIHTVNAEDMPLDELLDDDSTSGTSSGARGVHYAQSSPSGSDYDDGSDYMLEEGLITMSLVTPRHVASNSQTPSQLGVPSIPLSKVDAFEPDEPPASILNDNNDQDGDDIDAEEQTDSLLRVSMDDVDDDAEDDDH